jgi:DNA-binding NtrC family response regulator
MDELKLVLQRSIYVSNLEREYRQLQQQARAGEFEQMVGTSPQMEAVFASIRKVAGTTAPVLLLGESGTGKELAALAIHQRSPRKEKPFIPINCSGIPENLLESELFGHEKGAFTGATGQRVGRFEQCSGGTLFLDEIGDMPLALQAKILRVLQERVLERVGGRTAIPVDVRLLAATNKDLEAEIAKGNFREDLYYRIKVIHLHLPPLRDIREEIPLLANHFLKEYCRETARGSLEFAPGVLRKLTSTAWPGNVRQLRNEVTRLAACARGSVIEEDDLWEGTQAQETAAPVASRQAPWR